MLASNLLLCSETLFATRASPPCPNSTPSRGEPGRSTGCTGRPAGWPFLCTPTEPGWQQLCPAVGRPEWLEDPRYRTAAFRRRFNDQLVAELATALEARSAAEWEGLFARAGVAVVAPTRAPGMTSSCPTRKASATAS